MDFTIERSALLETLAPTTTVTHAKGTLPILQCVRISAAERDGLLCEATDLATRVVTRTPAAVAAPGTAAVVASVFAKLIRALPDGPIRIASRNHSRLSVVAAASTTTLPGWQPKDFPAWDHNEKRTPAQVSLAALDRTAPFASTESNRPHMCGVYVCGNVWAATDGHRLSRVELPGGQSGAQGIIPSSALAAMRALLDADPPAQLSIGPRTAQLSAGHHWIATRLIDGEFPDSARVLGVPVTQFAVVDRDRMRDALRCASVVATDGARGVRLGRNDAGQLAIHASSAERGECVVTVDAAFSTTDAGWPSVGLNGRYLAALLDVVPAEARLRIGASDDASPVVFTVEGDDTFKHVIMPMRL